MWRNNNMLIIQSFIGKIFLLVLLLVSVLGEIPCFAQEEETKSEVTAISPASNGAPVEDDGVTHKDVVRYTILIGAYPVTFLIGVKSWKWGEGSNHEFKSEKEGWFGQDTSFGGSDKAGHFYAHYVVQRALYNIFDYTENGAYRKWYYSLGTTIAVGTIIEIGDGWSSNYGFSYEDLIIDTAGLLFGAALDYFPTLDAFLGISIEYVPSDGYKKYRSDIPYDFINDYSGWKYLLNVKMAGFELIGFNAPKFLRYVQFDLGYYTRSYVGDYDIERDDYNDPSRHWFVGISVNLAEVVTDLFEDRNSFEAKIARKPFEYYHVPVGYKYSDRL